MTKTAAEEEEKERKNLARIPSVSRLNLIKLTNNDEID